MACHHASAVNPYDRNMSSSEHPRADKYTKIIAIGTVVLVLFGVVGLLASSKSKPTPTPTPTTYPTPTSTPTSTPTPAKLTYLAEMSPSEGATPQAGDFVLGGHHYETSIFYEGIEAKTASEGPCSGEFECRAVTYDLAGSYNTFNATFGITSKVPPDPPDGHFWVIAEKKVLRQGSFEGEQPVPLSLPLEHAQHLELKAAAKMGSGDPNIVWGNARVEP